MNYAKPANSVQNVLFLHPFQIFVFDCDPGAYTPHIQTDFFTDSET